MIEPEVKDIEENFEEKTENTNAPIHQAKKLDVRLIFIGTIVIIAMICITIIVVRLTGNKPEDAEPSVVEEVADEPEITNEAVILKLENVSELTTTRLVFNGLLHFEDGKIPFLTKKAFFMVYCADVEAGVDLSEATCNITDTTVDLILPQPEVFSVHIDPASIEFYDDSSALFNPSEKEDAIDSIAEAEADVRSKADFEQLKDLAKAQTTVLLEGLFDGLLGERKLNIQYQ